MDHILSLSYGKDSIAAIHVTVDILHWPLDRIIHAEVWATDTIPADLPPMVEFKEKANRIIKDRWGIEVENVRGRDTFEQKFYITFADGKRKGSIYGWPYLKGSWCNSRLKLRALEKAQPKDAICCIGVAADEPERIARHINKPNVKLPLVEAGWTEAMCRQWCEENDLLSPIYTDCARGGCWFCPNQGVDQLRFLRRNHPDRWALMLKWDKDSPVTFKAPSKKEKTGHTVHDFDRRFALEDAGQIMAGDTRFRWDCIEQTSLFLEG